MYIPSPVIVTAVVMFMVTPLRRIRLLRAVEDDLADEGVVPPLRTKKVEQRQAASHNNNAATSPSSSSSSSSSPLSKAGRKHHNQHQQQQQQQGGGDGSDGGGNGASAAAPTGRGGFGGFLGSARFIYRMGGLPAFYRGGLLESVSVLVKYAIQATVLIPICRMLPMRMHSSYMLTTLVHTIITSIPIAPMQMMVDAIIVNACSDFVLRDEDDDDKKKKEEEDDGAQAAGARPHTPTPTPATGDGRPFRYRFRSLWSAAKAAATGLPIPELIRRLWFLDIANRYASSLVFNAALGYFYRRMLGTHNGRLNSSPHWTLSTSAAILMRVVPQLVSIAFSVNTYPFVVLPFTHFARVKVHERRAAAMARARDEEEHEYRPLLGAVVSAAAAAANANANGSSPSNNNSMFADNASVARSHASAGSPLPPGERRRPRSQRFITAWAQRASSSFALRHTTEDDLSLVLEVMCPWEVRDYLWYNYEQWGVWGLYRGFRAHVCTIAVSTILGPLISLAWAAVRPLE